jgi:hypothetical protein
VHALVLAPRYEWSLSWGQGRRCAVGSFTSEIRCYRGPQQGPCLLHAFARGGRGEAGMHGKVRIGHILDEVQVRGGL